MLHNNWTGELWFYAAMAADVLVIIAGVAALIASIYFCIQRGRAEKSDKCIECGFQMPGVWGLVRCQVCDGIAHVEAMIAAKRVALERLPLSGFGEDHRAF